MGVTFNANLWEFEKNVEKTFPYFASINFSSLQLFTYGFRTYTIRMDMYSSLIEL